jgi:YbbR domain-containing protein
MKDWHYRVIAFFIALGLYFVATGQTENSVLTVTVPIQLTNLPKDRVVLLPTVLETQVKLQGPTSIVGPSASQLTFQYSLPAEVQNRHQLALTPESLRLPGAVKVVSIHPSDIELILDELVTRENVPVVVPKIGKVSENLRLTGLDVSPPKVSINGPKTEVDTIRVVESDPIDLRTIEQSVVIQQRLRPPGSFSQLSTEAVQVGVEITPVTADRSFSRIAVEVRSKSSRKFALSPSMVTVSLKGPKSKIGELNQNDVVPYVQIPGEDDNPKSPSGLISKAAAIPVKVSLPENIELIEIDPPIVQVRELVSPTN